MTRTPLVLLVAMVLACSSDSRNDHGMVFKRPSESNVVLAPSQPIVDGHAIIGKEAVGPLRIGMWRRPAMSFVYAIGAKNGKDSADVITVHKLGHDTVTLWFVNDTLRRIDVLKKGPHTASGIAVGVSDSLLRAVASPTPMAAPSGAGDTTWALRDPCGVAAVARRSSAPSGGSNRVIHSITVTGCTAASR